jgi:hypothetical protein
MLGLALFKVTQPSWDRSLYRDQSDMNAGLIAFVEQRLISYPGTSPQQHYDDTNWELYALSLRVARLMQTLEEELPNKDH